MEDCTHNGDFNPRSPRGERRGPLVGFLIDFTISIHAPLAGSDVQTDQPLDGVQISIHAPLAGSDFMVHHRLVLRV